MKICHGAVAQRVITQFLDLTKHFQRGLFPALTFLHPGASLDNNSTCFSSPWSGRCSWTWRTVGRPGQTRTPAPPTSSSLTNLIPSQDSILVITTSKLEASSTGTCHQVSPAASSHPLLSTTLSVTYNPVFSRHVFLPKVRPYSRHLFFFLQGETFSHIMPCD